MRVAILGSGAVGGYYGARLTKGGRDVTFVARRAHLAAIRARGLGNSEPGAEVAAVAGEARTRAGATYIASALEGPGLIVQTGDRRRIVFGEAFGELPRMTTRVTRIHEGLATADIQSYVVADGRVPVWEKFVFLAALAGFTGAARLPIGHRDRSLDDLARRRR